MILSLHKVYTTHVNYQYLLILNHFSKPKKSLPMIKLTLINYKDNTLICYKTI